VGGRHAPTALSAGITRQQLYRRPGGSQGRSGRVRKISPNTWIRSPDRKARSQPQYRLGYPGPQIAQGVVLIKCATNSFTWLWCLWLVTPSDASHADTHTHTQPKTITFVLWKCSFALGFETSETFRFSIGIRVCMPISIPTQWRLV